MKLKGELDEPEVDEAIEEFIRQRFRLPSNVGVKVEYRYPSGYRFEISDPFEPIQNNKPKPMTVVDEPAEEPKVSPQTRFDEPKKVIDIDEEIPF